MGLLLMVAALTVGCTKGGTHISVVSQGPTGSGRQIHANRRILVLMPNMAQADAVWQGMRGELAADFDLTAAHLDDATSVQELETLVATNKPNCIVLMNNSIVRLYRDYQKAQRPDAVFPPAVIVMTSFLKQTAKSVKNATGISYELPGVIQFVKLRSMLEEPVRRVGVVYRAQFSEFISAQRELARVEQIDLIGREMSREPTAGEVSNGIKVLLDKERVDALWVLNDNALLSRQMLGSAWLPTLHRRQRVPVIVGVPSLLSKEVPLGSIAMVPDHTALGVQTANLIFDLADDDWHLDSPNVALPISIRTMVDVDQFRKRFGLKEHALDGVDQIVE